jgi:hypothetical protein
VTVDASGNVYVADYGNALIRKITPSATVSTVAGTRGAQAFVAGPLPGAINPPVGMALFGGDLFFTQRSTMPTDLVTPPVAVVRSVP